MEETIRQRHAELVAARHANATGFIQLRARSPSRAADYGSHCARRIERLLPELSAPAPALNSDEASDAVQSGVCAPGLSLPATAALNAQIIPGAPAWRVHRPRYCECHIPAYIAQWQRWDSMRRSSGASSSTKPAT